MGTYNLNHGGRSGRRAERGPGRVRVRVEPDRRLLRGRGSLTCERTLTRQQRVPALDRLWSPGPQWTRACAEALGGCTQSTTQQLGARAAQPGAGLWTRAEEPWRPRSRPGVRHPARPRKSRRCHGHAARARAHGSGLERVLQAGPPRARSVRPSGGAVESRPLPEESSELCLA
jgi:hypothetical protein